MSNIKNTIRTYRQRPGQSSPGYTIIEVMIVLAVSGVMFVIAASFINDRQSGAAFTQGVNDLAAQMQNNIEQITNGQYTDIPVSCTYSGTTHIDEGSTQAQGTNQSCVFLGKLVHPHDTATAQYDLLTITGGRADSSGALITALACDTDACVNPNADPRVVPDLTAPEATPQGLTMNVKILDADGGGTSGNSFGFFQGQGALDALGSPVNGPQTVSLYYLTASPADLATSSAEQLNHLLKPASKVDICVTDDTRYAEIIMQPANSRLTVMTQMDGRTEPAGC